MPPPVPPRPRARLSALQVSSSPFSLFFVGHGTVIFSLDKTKKFLEM